MTRAEASIQADTGIDPAMLKRIAGALNIGVEELYEEETSPLEMRPHR